MDGPAEQLRWFDARLRGQCNGIDDEAPVQIFVMGANVWRGESEWPPARAVSTPFFLRSGGGANTLSGDGALSRTPAESAEPTDEFRYDPLDPVPTCGGQTMFLERSGPRDRREVEGRSDVLVFTSEVLDEALEVTGLPTLTLFAASSAPDTDWTATLVDVHPDGTAAHVTEGIVRARFRESDTEPSLIEPGAVVRYEIALWETSQLFRAGHRIRLEVSSSNFPRFDRNLNTGALAATDISPEVAMQTVHHEPAMQSVLSLPLIPAAAEPSRL